MLLKESRLSHPPFASLGIHTILHYIRAVFSVSNNRLGDSLGGIHTAAYRNAFVFMHTFTFAHSLAQRGRLSYATPLPTINSYIYPNPHLFSPIYSLHPLQQHSQIPSTSIPSHSSWCHSLFPDLSESANKVRIVCNGDPGHGPSDISFPDFQVSRVSPLMDLHCEEEMLSESEGGTPSGRKTGGRHDLLGLGDPSSMTAAATSLQLHASKDPAFVSDDRVLQNMLQLEERLMHSSNAFRFVQTEITAEMRQSVTTWMWEVCDEEGVPESVFLRAVNYLDKFLSVQRIDRTQFQLLGAACMLISSKWTGSVISPHRLIYYTANSISQDLLLEWELLVLSLFKWEMFTMVPTDFMDQLLFRLPKVFRDAPNIRETAKTYIACCATDCNFSLNPPSMIASSSIAASIGHHVPSQVLDQVLHTLHQVTNTETDVLRQCMEKVKMKIPVEKENFMVPGCMDHDDPGRLHEYAKDSHEINEMFAETPTDVADIHF